METSYWLETWPIGSSKQKRLENVFSCGYEFFIKRLISEMQHGIYDIKVTDNARAIGWRWRVNYICELYDGGKYVS